MAITTQRDGSTPENQWVETRSGDLPVRISASQNAKGAWQLDVSNAYPSFSDAESDFAYQVQQIAQKMRDMGLRLAGDE
jgi:hypothetical protein